MNLVIKFSDQIQGRRKAERALGQYFGPGPVCIKVRRGSGTHEQWWRQRGGATSPLSVSASPPSRWGKFIHLSGKLTKIWLTVPNLENKCTPHPLSWNIAPPSENFWRHHCPWASGLMRFGLIY